VLRSGPSIETRTLMPTRRCAARGCLGNEPRWNVADAKAHLSDLLRRAVEEVQVIENRGREVVGIEEYRRLRAESERGAPKRGLVELLRFSEEIRAQGGAELKVPARRPRRSPFARREPPRER